MRGEGEGGGVVVLYQLENCFAKFCPWSFPTTRSSSKSHLFPTKTMGTCRKKKRELNGKWKGNNTIMLNKREILDKFLLIRSMKFPFLILIVHKSLNQQTDRPTDENDFFK